MFPNRFIWIHYLLFLIFVNWKSMAITGVTPKDMSFENHIPIILIAQNDPDGDDGDDGDDTEDMSHMCFKMGS